MDIPFYYFRKSCTRNFKEHDDSHVQPYGFEFCIHATHNRWGCPCCSLWTTVQPLWWSPINSCLGQTSIWQDNCSKGCHGFDWTARFSRRYASLNNLMFCYNFPIESIFISIVNFFDYDIQCKTVRGMVASWLVRFTPVWAVQVWAQAIVLGKTLYFYSASLHPGVQMGTSKFNARDNPTMD